ncbi:MAG: PCMD domain-containing protein, partial [Muribaculaceae bacterium]|nr:PCMD domain-containing protein [Muribaculaceae bacterium]
MKKTIILIFIFSSILLSAQTLRLEPIKFGDMENWVTRNITESAIIGGQHKTLYEIAPKTTIDGNKPYKNTGGSPWANSNAFAKVCGVVKGSTTVSPAQRGGSTVAKCEAKMENVKALGIVNMDVMVAGSIFLGQLFEPVTSTKAAFSKMEMGIPYSKRPKALVYDYEIVMPKDNTRVKSTGFSKQKTLQGRDNAEVYVLLQRRWEDENGNLYAKRVGTGRERYNKSIPWTRRHELPIHYGDITKESFYKPWMGLLDGDKA